MSVMVIRSNAARAKLGTIGLGLILAGFPGLVAAQGEAVDPSDPKVILQIEEALRETDPSQETEAEAPVAGPEVAQETPEPVVLPEITEPEITEPEIAAPENVAPEMPTPEVAEPEVVPSDPEVVEVETPAPTEVTETAVTDVPEQPDTSAEAAPPVVQSTEYDIPRVATSSIPCVAELQNVAARTRLYFGLGSTSINLSGRHNALVIASLAQACPQARISVLGFADPKGSEAVNIGISWQRARNAIALIGANGYSTAQFVPVSHNELHSHACVHYDAIDRRVEFEIREAFN